MSAIRKDSGTPAHKAPVQRASMLVVEDDEAMARLVQLMVTSMGHTIAGALSTAEEALLRLDELAKEGKTPDVVLMDIRLPGEMDGVEAARIIHEKHGSSVVFLTGVGDPDVLKRALATRPMAYLVKPFDRNQIHSTLQIVLYQRRLEQELLAHKKSLEALNEDLKREMAERQRLERLANDLVEREREQLGRDLHDDLGQILSGLAIKGQVLRNALVKKKSPDTGIADEVVELARHAGRQVRDISRLLFPLSLRTSGLVQALQELASYAENHMDILCSLDCNEKLAADLDLMTATNLYRIAQEAVTNAVKHGAARQVRIALGAQGDAVVLAIQDDGKGMASQATASKGVGLQTMRYRAQMINGTLTIQTHPGGGTAITCSFRKSGKK